MSIVGVGDHRARVVDDLAPLADDRLRARATSRSATMRDLDAAAGAAPDLFLVALQHVEGAAADGADAEQADLDRFHAIVAALAPLQRAWRVR